MQDGYRRMPGIGEKWLFVVILRLFVLDWAYLCMRYLATANVSVMYAAKGASPFAGFRLRQTSKNTIEADISMSRHDV
jgi:hypothetical protein